MVLVMIEAGVPINKAYLEAGEWEVDITGKRCSDWLPDHSVAPNPFCLPFVYRRAGYHRDYQFDSLEDCL